jgi:hypothetical protein
MWEAAMRATHDIESATGVFLSLMARFAALYFGRRTPRAPTFAQIIARPVGGGFLAEYSSAGKRAIPAKNDRPGGRVAIV